MIAEAQKLNGIRNSLKTCNDSLLSSQISQKFKYSILSSISNSIHLHKHLTSDHLHYGFILIHSTVTFQHIQQKSFTETLKKILSHRYLFYYLDDEKETWVFFTGIFVRGHINDLSISYDNKLVLHSKYSLLIYNQKDTTFSTINIEGKENVYVTKNYYVLYDNNSIDVYDKINTNDVCGNISRDCKQFSNKVIEDIVYEASDEGIFIIDINNKSFEYRKDDNIPGFYNRYPPIFKIIQGLKEEDKFLLMNNRNIYIIDSKTSEILLIEMSKVFGDKILKSYYIIEEKEVVFLWKINDETYETCSYPFHAYEVFKKFIQLIE